MSKLLCVYHADCADGFAAAWAVHRRFGAEVEFHAARYGDIPPYCGYNAVRGLDAGFLKGRNVLIVDFSYPRVVLEAMAREARSVLVLDHHKTAVEQLAGLPFPPSTWEQWLDDGALGDGVRANLAAIFDPERSGAGIAWDYLFAGVPAEAPEPVKRDWCEEHNRGELPDGLCPECEARSATLRRERGIPRSRLIDLVEERDPETRRFHAVAASYGYEATLENFKQWDNWHEHSEYETQHWFNMLIEGTVILRAQTRMLSSILVSTRRTMRIGGFLVPVANVPKALAGEAAEPLRAAHDVERQLMIEFELGDLKYDPEGEGRMLDAAERSFHPDAVGAPFSATYHDGADGLRHFSLRSPPGGADVGAIAARYGGGGHARAAGFSRPLGWEGKR